MLLGEGEFEISDLRGGWVVAERSLVFLAVAYASGSWLMRWAAVLSLRARLLGDAARGRG
jgi:hypothetical protein